MLPWLRQPITQLEEEKEEVLVVISEDQPEPSDEKAFEPDVFTREYCSNCINNEGEIICPRRHRCRICKCHLDDDDWFAQFRK